METKSITKGAVLLMTMLVLSTVASAGYCWTGSSTTYLKGDAANANKFCTCATKGLYSTYISAHSAGTQDTRQYSDTKNYNYWVTSYYRGPSYDSVTCPDGVNYSTKQNYNATTCWAAISYLEPTAAQANKFCGCAIGTFSHISIVASPFSGRPTGYYLSTSNNNNWTTAMNSVNSPYGTITCTNSFTTPLYQEYAVLCTNNYDCGKYTCSNGRCILTLAPTTTTTTTSTTSTTTTTTQPTTTTTIPTAPEFSSINALIAVLLAMPTFAYLIVRKKK